MSMFSKSTNKPDPAWRRGKNEPREEDAWWKGIVPAPTVRPEAARGGHDGNGDRTVDLARRRPRGPIPGWKMDAGVLPQPSTEPNNRYFGTAALIVLELLKHNMRPDPDGRPRMGAATTRPSWAYYPVLLT
jgi:hypothetical protein